MAKKERFNYFDAFESQVAVAEGEIEVLIDAIENLKKIISLSKKVSDGKYNVEYDKCCDTKRNNHPCILCCWK